MFLQKIKQIVYQFDLFYSEQLFRCNANTQYKTLTGGLLSLALIIAISIGFTSMISDTLNRTSITSNLTTKKQLDPSLSIFKTGSDDIFMFSLIIQSFDKSYTANLSQIPRIFSFTAGLLTLNNGKLAGMNKTKLEQCTLQHWNMIP